MKHQKTTTFLLATIFSVLSISSFVAAQDVSVSIEEQTAEPTYFSPEVQDHVTFRSNVLITGNGLKSLREVKRSFSFFTFHRFAEVKGSYRALPGDSETAAYIGEPTTTVSVPQEEGSPEEISEQITDQWDGTHREKNTVVEDQYTAESTASLLTHYDLTLNFGFFTFRHRVSRQLAESGTVTTEFFVDQTPPEITVNSPSDSSTFSPDDEISFEVSLSDNLTGVDAEEVTVRLNDNEVTGQFSVSPSEIRLTGEVGEMEAITGGTNTFAVVAPDLAGNEREVSTTFEVEQSRKNVSLDVQVDGELTGGNTVTITATADVKKLKDWDYTRLFISGIADPGETKRHGLKTLKDDVETITNEEGAVQKIIRETKLEIPDDNIFRPLHVGTEVGFEWVHQYDLENKKRDIELNTREDIRNAFPQNYDHTYLLINPGGKEVHGANDEFRLFEVPSEGKHAKMVTSRPLIPGNTVELTLIGYPTSVHQEFRMMFYLPDEIDVVSGEPTFGPVSVQNPGTKFTHSITVKIPEDMTEKKEIRGGMRFGTPKEDPSERLPKTPETADTRYLGGIEITLETHPELID